MPGALRRDFDVLGAIYSHKEALQKQVTRLNCLIHTVDNTINHLKGNIIMSKKGLFEGFTEEEQEQYAAETEKMYDPETVRGSNRKWRANSPAKKEAIQAEGKAIYMDMIAVMPRGATSPEAQAVVERWRRHMDYFWTPSLYQLLALPNGYNSDPRFKANFDKMHPQLAVFFREAVQHYVKTRQ